MHLNSFRIVAKKESKDGIIREKYEMRWKYMNCAKMHIYGIFIEVRKYLFYFVISGFFYIASYFFQN